MLTPSEMSALGSPRSILLGAPRPGPDKASSIYHGNSIVSASRGGHLADVHVLDETEAAFSMAKFLHPEESKEYLNRDVVSLVTETATAASAIARTTSRSQAMTPRISSLGSRWRSKAGGKKPVRLPSAWPLVAEVSRRYFFVAA